MTGFRLIITYYGLRGMRSEKVYHCDLLYMDACTAVANICLPALVRTPRVARSPVCCRPNLCTLCIIVKRLPVLLAMRSIYVVSRLMCVIPTLWRLQ